MAIITMIESPTDTSSPAFISILLTIPGTGATVVALVPNSVKDLIYLGNQISKQNEPSYRIKII